MLSSNTKIPNKNLTNSTWSHNQVAQMKNQLLRKGKVERAALAMEMVNVIAIKIVYVIKGIPLSFVSFLRMNSIKLFNIN